MPEYLQYQDNEILMKTYDYEDEIKTEFGTIRVLPVWKMLLENE